MYPQINYKSLMECDEIDFTEILNDPDYRENQYLDYKRTFSFLEVDKSKTAEKISEFRNDVCAFANAEGGYLIYGIADKDGMASSIIGVDVDNPDKFELYLRNKLTPVMPKVPPIQFHFVKLMSGKYIVVMFIDHDYYAPYMHLEDQKNYKIYKREGNCKAIIRYMELKNMFIQSRVLETEILKFRKRRIEYYKEEGIEQFMLYHIIPESFLNDRKHLFLIEKKRNINFAAVFSGAGIDTSSIPCVDGLRFANTYGDEKAIIYNTGIVEYLLPLKKYITTAENRSYFSSYDVWGKIDLVSQGYQEIMTTIFGNQRFFGCVSVIGCKDVISEEVDLPRFEPSIDRNRVVCEPVVFTEIEDKNTFYLDLKRLHLEYLFALGIKRSPLVNDLINETKESED